MDKKKEVDYFVDGGRDNTQYLECITRTTRNDTLHRVHFYLPKVYNDADAIARYGIDLLGLAMLGKRQLSYLVASKAVFADEKAWDGDVLTQDAINAIQADADTIKGIAREKKVKKTEAQIKAEAIADLAKRFDMTTEEVETFLATKQKKKK